MCNNEAEKAKNDPLGFELRTFVAIPTFHENRGKVDDNNGGYSSDEFDVHDNVDFSLH